MFECMENVCFRTSLQEFLRDFIEKIYLGHVHLSVSNSINHLFQNQSTRVPERLYREDISGTCTSVSI